MPIREEAEMRATYDVRYDPRQLEAGCGVECQAVGTDYGNNGFTTKEQADELVRRLALQPDHWLLDVGSGSGFPGLYMGERTGCRVVVTDLTIVGMQQAARRAAADGLAARAHAVTASGRQLPFLRATFDGVVHTDLLCCVTAKLSVLRATGRLLRPGGRTAFYTILITPGLTRADHRRAAIAGPPAVAGPDAGDLLTRAGFADVTATDVTAEYLVAARAWYAARLEHRDTLRPLDPAVYDERVEHGRQAIAAIEAGLLRRTLYAGERRE